MDFSETTGFKDSPRQKITSLQTNGGKLFEDDGPDGITIPKEQDGSFWSSGLDYGCSTSSAIDEVLSQEDFTLEDLFEHEDIIQECKYLNNDLVEYLCRREIIAKLVSYVIQKPPDSQEEATLDPREKEKIKYHYISSELFQCEVPEMLDALFENPKLLELLFSFLDQPAPMDPSLCAYFCKVVIVLINKKHAQLVNFIQQTNQLEKILNHIGLYSIMELLIRVGWDDGNHDAQQFDNEEEIDSDWLHKANLVSRVVARMDPFYDNQPEVHVNAACALIDIVVKSSSVTPAISLLVDDLHSEPVLKDIFKYMFSGSGSSRTNTLSIVIVLVQSDTERRLSTTIRNESDRELLAGENPFDRSEKKVSSQLSPILKYSLEALPKLLEYLHNPTGLDGISLLTQSGRLNPPFGACRLKIVELVLALIRSEVQEIKEALVKHKVLLGVLEMFFNYSWNNMLHGLVETIIHTILDDIENVNSILKKNMFCEGEILKKICLAFISNEKAIMEPKGCRLGHMGHILRICTAISSCTNEESLLQMGIPKEEIQNWKALGEGQLSMDINQQQEVLGEKDHEDPGIDDGTLQAIGLKSNSEPPFDASFEDDFETDFETNFSFDDVRPSNEPFLEDTSNTGELDNNNDDGEFFDWDNPGEDSTVKFQDVLFDPSGQDATFGTNDENPFDPDEDAHSSLAFSDEKGNQQGFS